VVSIINFQELTLSELAAALAGGEISAVQLVEHYLQRIDQIDRHGPVLNAVKEINPAALAVAENKDASFSAGTHGSVKKTLSLDRLGT